MLKKLLPLLVCLGVLAIPARGQTGTVTVSGANLTDSSGAPISNAVIYFAPVNNSGQAISYRYAGKGQVITRPSSATITGGAFSLSLPDTSTTNPLNVCFSATIIDNNTGKNLLGPGYGCVQPAYNTSSPNAWCSGGLCNFDNYNPDLAAFVVQQTGPTGPPADIFVGSVTTLAPGTNATATLTGAAPNYTLNFGVPAGSGGVAANPAGGADQVQYNCGGSFCADSTFTYDPTLHALSANQVGALIQGGAQTGSAWGEKLLACMAAAKSAGTDFCDMRNLTGSQHLDSNLVMTSANASNMAILLPANLTVDQGAYQVQIQNGVTNLTIEGDLFGSNSAGSSGGATFEGCTTSGNMWTFEDAGTTGSFTSDIILKDFAIAVQASSSCNGENALYLGGGMDSVKLVDMVLSLPTGTSDPANTLVLNVPNISGTYSQHLEIDNPQFSGGSGVLETGTGLQDWGQVNVNGGYINASSNTGSLSNLSQACVTQKQGEFTPNRVDMEQCFVALHTYMGGEHGDIRPDGCCTTYSIIFDGTAATGNQYLTDELQSPTGTSNAGSLANININGAWGNGATPTGGGVIDFDGSEVGGSGFGTGAIIHQRLDDSEFDVVDASGKSAVQNVCKVWGDGSTGSLNEIWKACKGTTNGFSLFIDATVGGTAYNWAPLSFDLTYGFGMNSFGSHPIAIDYGNAGTAGPGIDYYGGGTSPVWSVSAVGVSTATGFAPAATQTTVNCSTSGSAVFSEPFVGSSYKKTVVFLNACNGTASYTMPTPFGTIAEGMSASSGVSLSDITSFDGTALTITGSGSTGIITIEGY